MKRFLSCFSYVVLILLLCAGGVWGGGAEVVNVCIGNIEKVTGGNAAAGGVFNADVMKLYEKNEYKHYAHLVSLEEAWAHYKFTLENKPYDPNANSWLGNITLLPKGQQVSQIPANIVPQSRVLSNAASPISIISCSDKIFLYFSRELDCDTELVRMLDEKGRVLAKLDDPYGEGQFEIVEVKVSPEYRNYYLEVKQFSGRYFYIFLKMKATDTPAKKSAKMSEEKARVNNLALIEKEVRNEYMRQHNISDPHNLTAADKEAIVEIIKDKTMSRDVREQQRFVDQVVKNYMKQHSITDYNQLTKKDWEIIQSELQNSFQNSQQEQKKAPSKKSSSKKKHK